MSRLEAQLRTWKPRPPSARLEARIFSPPAADSRLPLGLPWLVPVTACLMAWLAAGNQRYPVKNPALAGGQILALGLSNQSLVACVQTGYASSQNDPRPDTFEWTNNSGSTSSMRSLTPTKPKD